MAKRIVLLALAGLFLLGSVAPASAQEGYEPSRENLEARAWFQDARFGLFVHWGVYSVPGRGEWVMHNERISVGEYEGFPPLFNPTEFDPRAWVSMAKAAGMRYITITSKHHDGFALYDSKVSDYDIVDRTPYEKDVLAMLAEECRKQGLKPFFYYSQLDWRHPDYFPRGRTGQWSGREEEGQWDRYLDYMDAQLEELLTGYGPLGGIWFDGWWDRPEAARTKSPMPPESWLRGAGWSPAAWRDGAPQAALRDHLAGLLALAGTSVPQVEQQGRRAYETLQPCLGTTD